jgi:hypothetical protein
MDSIRPVLFQAPDGLPFAQPLLQVGVKFVQDFFDFKLVPVGHGIRSPATRHSKRCLKSTRNERKILQLCDIETGGVPK